MGCSYKYGGHLFQKVTLEDRLEGSEGSWGYMLNRTSAKALRQESAKKQQGGKCGILQAQVRKVSTYEGKRKGSTVQY